MSILFDGTNHPSAQQVIDAGCVGCLMYGGTPQYAKNFTGTQYRDYKARSLMTLFAFEVGANDMDGGATAGTAHARTLIADLRSKGVDEHEPVCATVDKHVAVANIKLAAAYQQGFYSAVKATGWVGRAGGYGFSEFLIAIHDAGVADWYWGAGSRSAMPPYTNIWQDNTGVINVGGSADDRDWILIPLEAAMDWSDPRPNPIYDPANKNPADERSYPTYTMEQYIKGPWAKTLALPALAAQIAGLVSAVTALTNANAANQPITQAELTAIVDQAVQQHVQITGTVQITPAPPASGGTP